MALQTQNLNINFSQGLETKSDPKQIPPGKFLSLQNSVFTKTGLLTKRNGFARMSGTIQATSLNTFKGALVALGDRLQSRSPGSDAWVDKGLFAPIDLSVSSLVKGPTNQVYADSAVSSSGLVCTVVVNDDGAGNITYMYTVSDYVTGQQVVPLTPIAPTAGSIVEAPRVFALRSYFIITLTTDIASSLHLQRVAISLADPTIVVPAADISTQYDPNGDTLAYDAAVANGSLYVAWNGNDMGGAVRIAYISNTLLQSGTVAVAGEVATMMSVVVDNTTSLPTVWAVYYDSDSFLGRAFAVNTNLHEILAPTTWITGMGFGLLLNVTGTAKNNVCDILYEVDNNYGYDAAIATHYVATRSITIGGSVGSGGDVMRGVGLASKAFLDRNIPYVMVTYQSDFQSSYYLLNTSPAENKVVAKVAYSNGLGYVSPGLSGVTSTDSGYHSAYLYKEQVIPVNKTQGVPSVGGVYANSGVNLATFKIDPNQTISSSEIGSTLNISGGVTWAYDGDLTAELGFNLWPDSVEVSTSSVGGSMAPGTYYYQALYEYTDAQGNINRSAPSIPVLATVIDGSFANHTWTDTDVNTTDDEITITGHGYETGMAFTVTTAGSLPSPLVIATTYYAIVLDVDTIQVALTYEDAVDGVFVDLSTAGTGTSTVVPADDQGSVEVNIPTLRVTNKPSSSVKIEIYRWSTTQQIFYEITTVLNPLLNDTTVDYLTYTDMSSDADIIGNTVIYTTGQVLENIGPPGAAATTLFKSRLFLVDSENRNTLWYSKPILQATPVEMSDLQTIYVAPTVGAQGDTGPITALSSMDDKLIIFKKNAIYYITGDGPNVLGTDNSFSEPVFITSTVGCINQNSIVFMPQGLMFQSDKGIWLLGRNLQTTYIGAPVELYNDAVIKSALTIPGTNQVRFTLSSGITLMYDYYFDQWGTFYNIPALSSTLYLDMHTFINSFGQVFQEEVGSYKDGSNPVLMSFKTGWFNLAGLQGFERAKSMWLLGEYLSPHKLNIQVAYDYANWPSQSVLITPDNAVPAWGGESYWGNGQFGGSSLEQWRVFFDTQKCQAFQIHLNEIFDNGPGLEPGAGFTLSGLDLEVAVKKGRPYLPASRQAG